MREACGCGAEVSEAGGESETDAGGVRQACKERWRKAQGRCATGAREVRERCGDGVPVPVVGGQREQEVCEGSLRVVSEAWERVVREARKVRRGATCELHEQCVWGVGYGRVRGVESLISARGVLPKYSRNVDGGNRKG